MSNFIKEEAIQYFSDSEAFCNRIDKTIEDFQKCEGDIQYNRDMLIQKRRTYIGSNFFLTIAFAMSVFSLCAIVLTHFFAWPFLILALPLAIITGYIVKWRYTKFVLPVYENIYQRYIREEQKWMKELLEELYLDRDQYEITLSQIPVNMRHPAAMSIMRESIETGYANSLDDSIDFYRKRYAVICKSKTNDAKDIKNTLQSSEEKAETRFSIIISLDEIAAPYLN